jgi:hypothetical protein
VFRLGTHAQRQACATAAMLDRLSGYLYRKSDGGAPAGGKSSSFGAATHNVASYNMMAAAYNPQQPMMPMSMPPMPMPADGTQLDPAIVASFNMNYQMQMQQMQAQMQAMQAMLHAQHGQATGAMMPPPPASNSSNGGAPSPLPLPASSTPLPAAPSSTMPALQQYHMAAHQVPQPPSKPEVAPMQLKALCNNIYSLVKVRRPSVAATDHHHHAPACTCCTLRAGAAHVGPGPRA